MTPSALRLQAGPCALRHVREHGLLPDHVRVIPAAAGGPKGLILSPLDQFLFADWLPQSRQPLHLIGASIGAWRMATACLPDPRAGFARLSHDYIHQHYELAPGQTRPTPQQVSDEFGATLRAFFTPPLAPLLQHPRYRLHVLTSRGRRLLRREHHWRSALGFGLAVAGNAVHRRALGGWLERVVFSTDTQLPFAPDGMPTRQVRLNTANFHDALQASCSIPFVLRAVHDIAAAPAGAYWDGGLIDYHLHLDYAGAMDSIAAAAGLTSATAGSGIVLYPHFQSRVVPGWLDKHLRWRHRPTAFLDHLLLLSPQPQWVQSLPGGKLPDRSDFMRYADDPARRIRIWQAAVDAAEQLAHEWQAWLQCPDPARLEPW